MLTQMYGGGEGLVVTVAEALTAPLMKPSPLLLNLWMWQQEGGENWATRLWNEYINRKWEVGNFTISLTSLALGLVVLLAALLVSRSLRSLFERRLAAYTHLDPGIQYTLLRLVHYIIVAIGLLVASRFAFAADLTSLAVLFTALSVGIGFGLQFIAGDIAAGFILLFERPVSVGDFITVNGPNSKTTEGKVQSINLRTTVVLTNDHISAIVPNSQLTNQNLINWSYHDRRARISIPIGVSYNSDVELVTRTLLRAAQDVNYVLADPKPSVQFLNFGDWSLDFRLLVWTDRPRRHPQIKSDINYRIRKLFIEEEIEIPFPQRDFNLRGGALRIEPRRAETLLAPAGDDRGEDPAAAAAEEDDDRAGEETLTRRR